MFEQLPSVCAFQPHFYEGGPSRFYLPLLYDLVAALSPRAVVTLGWDAEVHFTLCQSAREHAPACRLISVRHAGDGDASDDRQWHDGLAYSEEFYHDISQLIDSGAVAPTAVGDDGIVDLLIVQDFSLLKSAREDFGLWKAKLSPAALVLVSGIDAHREGGGPREFWNEVRNRHAAELPLGNAVGLTSAAEASAPLLVDIFGNDSVRAQLTEIYAVIVQRIDAAARAEKAERENRLLRLRQVWQPTLLDDRVRMQETIDHLNRHIEHLTRVHEWDLGQSQHRERALEHQLRVSEHDRGQPGPQSWPAGKSIAQRVLSEARRIPRNLRKLIVSEKAISSAPTAAVVPEPKRPVSNDARYAEWIAQHEFVANPLSATEAPTISLIVPLHQTPAKFLGEMIESVVAQTDPNWQLCLVATPFRDAAAQGILDCWRAAEPRIRFEALDQNGGIANNTNRALQLAEGDFIALLDHDDLLAPFAVAELRKAIAAFPNADIFYSDEDRWNEGGQRHSPFFKPEWSPELLFSCMYLGHLSAYRRSLVEKLGGFRAEFDLSQDYDLALRATEAASEIRHIPHVLYHWREHPDSGSAGGKPEARRTNLASLRTAIDRRQLAADVIAYPAANRVRMRSTRTVPVSIIVPSDSADRTAACAIDLPRATGYGEFEIVIVINSTLARALEVNSDRAPNVRSVAYDSPFNFSDKCNAGAREATGEVLIFFNDDVSPLQTDWIENLIEPLSNPEIGAVAPKMSYADGRLQHAGLVTGVRGLVGTAFHLSPHDSTEHVNFIQSMRDVSALSAACLAVRRDDFFRLGGFDAERFPIIHSDVDLSFRIRDLGLRCVYTPFVSMRHLGHASLRIDEDRSRAVPEKADVSLLKRWAGHIAHDPYFPPNMRDWLYRDSPAPLQIFGSNCTAPAPSSRDVLYLCADLQESESTYGLFRRAIDAKQRGDFVVIMAAAGAPFARSCAEAGIVLIADPLVLGSNQTIAKLCGAFDLVVLDPTRCEHWQQTLGDQNVTTELLAKNSVGP